MTINRDALEKSAEEKLRTIGAIHEAKSTDVVKGAWVNAPLGIVLDAILPDVRKAALLEAAQIAEATTEIPMYIRWHDAIAAAIRAAALGDAPMEADPEWEYRTEFKPHWVKFGTGKTVTERRRRAGEWQEVAGEPTGDAPTGGE